MRLRSSRARLGSLLATLAVLASSLVLVLPTAALGQSAPPAQGRQDIVFAVDGSGSIDNAEWALQKDGITAALQDRAAFPLDGTIAVGLVQWSTNAVVQVPLTVLDSEATLNSVIAQVQAVPRMGDLTGPGVGMQTSTAHLTAAGRNDADWSVCMSADGTTNTGPAISGAAAAAQSAGVDKFSVIGIVDGSNGPSLQSHYAPTVFGGGTFTLARNNVEFASLIVGACVNEPVELAGLEVNQSIQSWKNTVPLVEDKPTVVRAFVQVKDGQDPQRVHGRLIGRRNGVELPGSPLTAANAGGSVLAEKEVADRRDDLTASLNFVLPVSWRSGTVELEFDGAGTAVTCEEAAGPTPKDCKATVTFQPGADAELKVVGVAYKDSGTTKKPTRAALRETGYRVRTTLPVSSMSISVQDELFSAFNGVPHLADVNSRLSMQRFLDLCFPVLCDTLYYGQLSGKRGGGQANGIPGDVSSGFDYDVTGRDDPGFFRNVAAHEVGHTLGAHHSVRAAVSGGVKTGPCGEVADSSAPTYPYFGTVGGTARSLLHQPGAAEDDQMWGIDARFARNNVKNLAVVAPEGSRATFDLMGYCYIGSPQDLWPSDYTYKLLRDGLNARFASQPQPLARVATTAGPHLIFTGRIDKPGAAGESAMIDPPALVDGDVPTFDPGDYTLRLLDGSDATLAEVSFKPDLNAGRPPAGGADGDPTANFIVPVPAPATPVAKVEVLHGAAVIGSVTGSPTAPTVATTDPAPGSTNDGDTVRFAWTASDPDGGPLRFHVRYSPDGGSTWKTLAVAFDGTEIEVPRDQLTGSDNAVFEVQATDGLNLTRVLSAPFTVGASGPEVVISSPADNETFYSGVQQVVLEAEAFDNEDGDVSGSIVWTSDVDGRIFTGPRGSIGADRLSEGIHRITATATDSDGVTGEHSVTIQVYRVAPPPPPPEPDPDPDPDPEPGPDPDVLGVMTARLYGADRVDTAIAISRDSFGDAGAAGDLETAEAVVLARSDLYPDALAGAALASATNGPLLLTPPTHLDDRVLSEIDRVLGRRGTVHLLGGEAALSAAVESALKQRGYRTVRYDGRNRFETAVKIAEDGLGSPKKVLLATGLDFPDALTAGAVAAGNGSAVLLTAGDRAAGATSGYLQRHRPSTVHAVGGPAARAYRSATPVYGADRFATAVEVAKTFGTDDAVVGVTTGMNFPDAITGGAHIARHGGMLLLTPPQRLSGVTRAYLESVVGDTLTAYVYGGTAAVSDAVLTELSGLIR